jgi:TRAP-type mannitol/chloroaromatic compound transport system substrate-binding protein
MGSLFIVLFVFSMVLTGCSVKKEEPAKTGEKEPAAKTYKLTMQISAAAGTPYMTCAQQFAQAVKESSGGRLIIDVQAGGAIVPAHEVTDAVKGGVLDIAAPNPSMDQGRLGAKALLFGASGTPGGPNAIEYLGWFYKGDGMTMANDLYKDFNAEVIGVVTAAPAELFCHSNKPITSLKDFQGLKFRTMGLWGEVMKSLGASVITVAGGEIYQAMERGVVDAFEYCGPGVDWDMGFHEVTKYIGVPGIHSPLSSNLLIVNKNKWDQLPDDLKELLKHEAMAASLRDYLEFSYADVNGLQKYKDYGTKIFVLPDDIQKEIAARAKAIMEKYAQEDAAFKKIYDNQLDFIKKWKNREDSLQPKYSLFN